MKFLIFFRSLIVVLLLFPIYTSVLSLFGIVHTQLTKRREGVEFAALLWARWTLKLFGIKLRVIDPENLPKERGCLLLFNHTSFMDIFAITSFVERIKFGAKIELFSIPFFGGAMRSAGVLPIARENRDETIRIYQEAEKRAALGERFALSPEGKRNTKEELLPFKTGPFIFAIRAQMPIVPVVIKGANAAWPKGALVPALKAWNSEITVQFLPTVETKGETVENRSNLSKQVRDMMLPFF